MNDKSSLQELVLSERWDDTIRTQFFEKLKKSKDSYNKSKNCVDKALNIIKGDTDNAEVSLELINYAIDNFADDQNALARAYSVKGEILENYKADYIFAFDCYQKWADLNTNLIGHEFARVRALLRANKLNASDAVDQLFLSLKDDFVELPTREYRFWVSVLTSSLYLREHISEKSANYAKAALQIYKEQTTFLQNTIEKLKNIPDEIHVTEEELDILHERVQA